MCMCVLSYEMVVSRIDDANCLRSEPFSKFSYGPIDPSGTA